MAISTSHRCILVIRTVLYGCTVISSFFVFGALAVSLSRHKQSCLLYLESNGKHHFRYSSRGPCDYSIAIATVCCLVCPLIIIVVTILALLGIFKDKIVSFTSPTFLLLVIWDLLAFIFSLVSASIISAGLKQTCDVIIKEMSVVVKEIDIPCTLAAVPHGNDIRSIDFFYTCLAVAQGGAWAASCAYLVQVMIDLGVLYVTNRLPCWNRATRRDSAAPECQTF